MKKNSSQLLLQSVWVAPLLALCGFAVPNSAQAGKTIVQDINAGTPTSGWLAFEAEDYDHLIDLDGDGVSWSVVDDVDANPTFGASGGKTLRADDGAGLNALGEADAVYNVKFTIADRYRVFARYKNLGDVTEGRSIWTSGDPNIPFPEDPLATWFGDGTSEAEIVRTTGNDPFFLADPNTPEYFYAFIGAAHIGSNPAVQNAADIDEVVEFRIGVRTAGVLLDRIVFVDGTTPGPIDQTLPPPGPSGFRYQPLFQMDALPNSPVEITGTPGDFDGDLDVDGEDFLIWQRDLGDAPNLLLWEANYGTPAPAVGGAFAVPEPSSCLLLLAGGVMVAVRRRR